MYNFLVEHGGAMSAALAAAEVVVRLRFTDRIDSADYARDLQVLSSDERERAARFRFDDDRAAFAAAHALLRRTLSECCSFPFNAWSFAANPGGKPTLAGDCAHTGLRFNLAHTRGLVACAVALRFEVGIDIEGLPRTDQCLAIADRFFSEDEVAALRVCPSDDQPIRFLELWTLKECYIKGIGKGLSQALDAFSFRFDGTGSIRFQSSTLDAEAWQFALFAPAERFRMAIAVSAVQGVPALDVRDETGRAYTPVARSR